MSVTLSPSQAHALLLQRTDYQPTWAKVLRRGHLGRLYDGAASRVTPPRRRRELALLYLGEMTVEAAGIVPHLPDTHALRVLDIGCGLAGIDAVIHAHRPDARFTLLDRDQFNSRPHYGFQPEGAAYNSLADTVAFLESTGVAADRITAVNIEREPFPTDQYDLVISLLSWGHHYPIGTYLDDVCKVLAPGGVVIVDVRRGTSGVDELRSRFGRVEAIDDDPAKVQVRVAATV